MAGQDHSSWMMKCDGLVPRTLHLRGYTTKSQENPHGHQKPNTDPKNRREETNNCERGHLGHFHTSPSTSGGRPPHPLQEDISVATPFDLTSATTRLAPCVPSSSLPNTPRSTVSGGWVYAKSTGEGARPNEGAEKTHEATKKRRPPTQQQRRGTKSTYRRCSGKKYSGLPVLGCRPVLGMVARQISGWSPIGGRPHSKSDPSWT